MKAQDPSAISLPTPTQTDTAGAIQSAMEFYANAWDREAAKHPAPTQSTPSDGADRARRAGRILATLLAELRWTLRTLGQNDPPRPMAQLAVTEPEKRHVVLYTPFLRWIAGQWSTNGVLPQEIARWNPMIQIACETGQSGLELCGAILEVWAVAHEAFHVFHIEAEMHPSGFEDHGPNLWNSLCCDDCQAIEQGARTFAEGLLLKYVL